MIQDAVPAGFPPKHPLETRLVAVVETALSTYLGAFDDEDGVTAELCVQKAAQAAEEAWQKTVGGPHSPSATNPTALRMKIARSRLNAPQLQLQL